MKKFLVLLVIVVMTCMSSMAFAADVSVNGSIEYRLRNLTNLDLADATHDNQNITSERVRLNIDAKAGDALSGRIGIENDWDAWGRFESVQGNGAETTTITSPTTATTTHGTQLALREAWIGFKVPGTPVGVKGGHMLLQLGNAWFFRSMKYGSDAWVVYSDIDALHLGFVDIKVGEGVPTEADDTDAYAFVGTYKISDTMSAGVNFTNIMDRNGKTFNALYGLVTPNTVTEGSLQNLGLHFSGDIGPVKLNAEVDVQMGDVTNEDGSETKFKGNQFVLQANLPLDALTINATVARGSGAKAGDTDVKEFIAFLDGDTHYTLIYEYLINTAAQQSFKTKGTGFANTTAVSVGAGFNVTKNLMIGADAWWLMATEDVAINGGAPESDLGMEIDAKINWKLYENLALNTTIGYFIPGDAYKFGTVDADPAQAIQAVLSFKF